MTAHTGTISTGFWCSNGSKPWKKVVESGGIPDYQFVLALLIFESSPLF
jgi:hypothetical protein